MTRKLAASLFYLSLLPSLLMAANNVVVYRADGTPFPDRPVNVSGSQQEQPSFERIFWNKTPVSVTLKTGSERLIHFPDMVRARPPEERTFEELKMTIVDNVIYLKALKDFPTGRMKVQAFNHTSGSFDGGVIYFLDLSAKRRGGTEPIQIIDTTHSAQGSTYVAPSGQVPNASASSVQASLPSIDMVELVRFASQQLYAPERLMPSHPAIYRSPLQVKTLKSLYRGGGLQSTPLASWKGGGLYVTAVKLQNTTPLTMHLDPRLFRGQWRSRTLQHAGLSHYQSESDTTTVYLISDRPFHESLWF